MPEFLSKNADSVSHSRRRFLTTAGVAGAAALGSGLLATDPKQADAAEQTIFGPKGHRFFVSDVDIANFALNLEYLEAEFYLRAVNGAGLSDADITGGGAPGSYLKPKSTTPGAVTGGRQVNFTNSAVQQYAQQIAADEQNHVKLLRSVLGKNAVARPAIDLQTSFTNAAIAAGVIQTGQTFDPFANDLNFLLGAFIFEDVGVTAYHGAAPFVRNSAILNAAAGILGTEAYHAGNIRTSIFTFDAANPTAGLVATANKISALRAAADGDTTTGGHDRGVTDPTTNKFIVAPVDANGVTFARTFDEVLRIVYLNATSTTPGGFFPNGLNGRIS